jgi:hypothetical protein
VADVEDVVAHLAGPGLEHRDDAAGGVAHVDVGPPELLAEDFEVATGPEFAGELVDGEVEAHALSGPVDRREAQAGGDHRAGAVGQEHFLDLDLLLGVEGDRRQRRLLVDGNLRVGHAAVVGAGRGEHEVADSGRARVVDETAGRLDVDLGGQLGILRAGGVADDRRQVHDRVDSLDRLPAQLVVADVADQDLGAALGEAIRDRLLSVQEAVEDAHLTAALKEFRRHFRADVTGASRYQSLAQVLASHSAS